jgi:hypothetical protein
MARALVIRDEEKRKIVALKELAAAKPVVAAEVVKEDPERVRERNRAHTIDLPFGFEVTFTEEIQPVGRCLHISISVDAPNRSPHPAAVEMILEEFGMRPLEESLSVWVEELSPGVAVNVLQRGVE